jgi:hypothetical protein
MLRLASTWHAETLAFSSRWIFRFTFSLFGCGGLEYETHTLGQSFRTAMAAINCASTIWFQNNPERRWALMVILSFD